MAFSTEWRINFREGYDQGRISGNARPQRLLGGTALAGVALACTVTLWVNLSGRADRAREPQLPPAIVTKGDARQTIVAKSETRLALGRTAYAQLAPEMKGYARRALAQSGYAKLAAEMNSYAQQAALSNSYARLFDSHDLGGPPGSFAPLPPLVADSEPAQPATVTASIDRQAAQRDAAAKEPLRVPPLRTASLREAAQPSRAAGDAPAEKPSIFERLFGKPKPVALAYAAPDDGDLGGESLISGRYDHFTAVYDISARKVYMPDGTALEAHSGLGGWLDDPRHVDERMRGATPPTVYNLKLRESLFHGVQAIRLIPEDERQVFGRSGLLAHTYMLGPNGDSNGCVSFRNYNAFLHAYLNGRVKRLAVVTRLD